MFGLFKPKPADVLSHWYAPVPNYNASTEEFYAAVEQELKAQQVPGLQVSRVDFAEGSVVSAKRTYLRLTRDRLVFDVCAAPFGVNYFYSCRFAEQPKVVGLGELIALAVVLVFSLVTSFGLCLKVFGILGPFMWPLCWIGFILLAIYTMRNSAAMGLADLDATLLKIPILNSIYEAWFRRETYYRVDTRLMYMTVVEGVVKKLVEETTAAKGVTLLTEYEHAPILRELYRIKEKSLKPRPPAPA